MHSVQPPDTTATPKEHVGIVFLYLPVETLGNIILHTNAACRNRESSSWEIGCECEN